MRHQQTIFVTVWGGANGSIFKPYWQVKFLIKNPMVPTSPWRPQHYPASVPLQEPIHEVKTSTHISWFTNPEPLNFQTRPDIWVSTLFTSWEINIPCRTESLHFLGLMNSANKQSPVVEVESSPSCFLVLPRLHLLRATRDRLMVLQGF